MAEETTTTPVKATVKKRKIKRSVPSGQVHIQATFNNTIITITDTKGNALINSSAGASGFRGSKKSTAYAAQIASEKAANDAVNTFGMKKVDVSVKGIGLGRDAAIRALHSADLQVNAIKDVTPIPHGGVRPKGVRKP